MTYNHYQNKTTNPHSLRGLKNSLGDFFYKNIHASNLYTNSLVTAHALTECKNVIHNNYDDKNIERL